MELDLCYNINDNRSIYIYCDDSRLPVLKIRKGLIFVIYHYYKDLVDPGILVQETVLNVQHLINTIFIMLKIEKDE